MSTGLNEEFYEHLHALEDRYGYAFDGQEGKGWVCDADDDDPDLVFCQNYIKEKFAITVDDDFNAAFLALVLNKKTNFKEIAAAVNCSETVARRLMKKHGLEGIYKKYQAFYRATVIYDVAKDEYFAAATMKDVLRFCGFNKEFRVFVSRAKSKENEMNGYYFYSMERFLNGEPAEEKQVEDLYEQKITRIA